MGVRADRSVERSTPRNEQWACEGGVGRHGAPLVHYPAPRLLVAWSPGAAWRWLAGWLLLSTPTTPTTATTPNSIRERSRGDLCNTATWGHFLPRLASPHIPRCVGAVEPCGAGTGDFARLQPAPPPASLQALFSPKPSFIGSGRDSRSGRSRRLCIWWPLKYLAPRDGREGKEGTRARGHGGPSTGRQ